MLSLFLNYGHLNIYIIKLYFICIHIGLLRLLIYFLHYLIKLQKDAKILKSCLITSIISK